MGAAGRERAVEQFRWEHVVHAYEDLWVEQQRELESWKPASRPPAPYPAPEQSFAGYPTAWLADGDRVQATPGAADRLATFLSLPLTNLVADRRCADVTVLQRLLQRAERPVQLENLALELEQAGTSATAARATIAWLLKYELLSR